MQHIVCSPFRSHTCFSPNGKQKKTAHSPCIRTNRCLGSAVPPKLPQPEHRHTVTFFRTRSPLKRCRCNARPAARPTFFISGCSSGVFFRVLSPSRLAPDARLSARFLRGTFPLQRFYWLKNSTLGGWCQGLILQFLPFGILHSFFVVPQFLQGFGMIFADIHRAKFHTMERVSIQ